MLIYFVSQSDQCCSATIKPRDVMISLAIINSDSQTDYNDPLVSEDVTDS